MWKQTAKEIVCAAPHPADVWRTNLAGRVLDSDVGYPELFLILLCL
jgi:hypothetical protein